MFEQSFNNIDVTLYKDSVAGSELGYVGNSQKSKLVHQKIIKGPQLVEFVEQRLSP